MRELHITTLEQSNALADAEAKGQAV